MVRMVVSLTLAVLALNFIPGPAASELPAADGVTALTTLSGTGSTVLRPDPSGNYFVFVIAYQKSDDVWGQVATNGTLRVSVFGEHTVTTETDDSSPPGVRGSVKVRVSNDGASVKVGESGADQTAKAEAETSTEFQERVSVAFQTAPSGAVKVSFPAASLVSTTGEPTIVKLVIDFEDLGASVSHNVVKNQLINGSHFDEADLSDGVAQPVVAAQA